MVIDTVKYDLNDGESCIELLSSLGFDRYDLDAIVRTLQDHKLRGKANTCGIEGLIGDDLYQVQEAVRDCIEEIGNEADNLNAASKKGNTRADIARRLSAIATNLSYYNDTTRIYEYSDF